MRGNRDSRKSMIYGVFSKYSWQSALLNMDYGINDLYASLLIINSTIINIQAKYCTLEHAFLGAVEKLCTRSAHFSLDGLHPPPTPPTGSS